MNAEDQSGLLNKEIQARMPEKIVFSLENLLALKSANITVVYNDRKDVLAVGCMCVGTGEVGVFIEKEEGNYFIAGKPPWMVTFDACFADGENTLKYVPYLSANGSTTSSGEEKLKVELLKILGVREIIVEASDSIRLVGLPVIIITEKKAMLAAEVPEYIQAKVAKLKQYVLEVKQYLEKEGISCDL